MGGIEGSGDAGAFGGAHQLAEDFGVQAKFVAESVVDGGNIGAGARGRFRGWWLCRNPCGRKLRLRRRGVFRAWGLAWADAMAGEPAGE